MCGGGGGGGGGVFQVHLLQKSLATFFFFQFNYFSPQLILSDYILRRKNLVSTDTVGNNFVRQS